MPIIDSHTYIGDSIFDYRQSADELLSRMDSLGIEKSIIIPVKPYDYHFPPQNDFISKTAQQYSRRFIPFCRVDPKLKDSAVSELQRCITELHTKGLFLHPWEETFQINSEFVIPLIQLAEKHKLPVMIAGGHIRVSMPCQIADLAKQFPNVIFIATSGGQINICGAGLSEARVMLRECPNVIMETSGIYRQDFIEDSVKDFGAERIVFGSGSPIYDSRLEIERCRWAHITDKEKNLILGENIEKICQN